MAAPIKPKKPSSKSKKSPASKGKRNKLRRDATFVGIDLAWSERNPTGCAIIRNQRLIAYTGELGSDSDVVAFISAHMDDECPAVVGIDAPLRVPNETGSRLCDRALSAEWRTYEAGALPANRQIFERMSPLASAPVNSTDEQNRDGGEDAGLTDNPVRGERLVTLLTERLRFSEAATIPLQTDDRLVCEIYPHPAHVSLFGLTKTLKYKSRSKRSYESRWSEFERYQNYLRTLRWSSPELRRTKQLLTKVDVRTMRGKALKAYEDTLDAITCAYVVSYLWTHGPNHARTYGTLGDGHIIVPITEYMARKLV